MNDAALQPTISFGRMAAGTQIGERYEVRGWLGEGGMGTVYRVLDRELDEDVALKLLRPELSKMPDALVRFRREVKLARKVVHPAVARTYDLGSHEGQRYLTMELISGGSLAARAKGHVPLPDVLRIVSAVSAGLAASHAAGVVHRDLKPDNILLSGERVVITDFGIARALTEQDALATSGAIVGTPAYMAPEQLGNSPIDGRADVYALGVVLFELLTARLPFDGDTPFAIAAARLTVEPPDLRAIAPDLPEGVTALVKEALSRKREQRPDAQTLHQRIEALRGGRREITARDVPSGGTRATLLSLGAPPEGTATVRVAPFDAEGSHASLAADLTRAVTDALTSERDVKLAAPNRPADLTVEGALRVAGSRARIRLRLVDGAGAPLWADRVEGDVSDPFALEDATVERARDAVRTRTAKPNGPPDGPVRARWEAARGHVERFDHGSVRTGVAMLEELHAEAPSDPWVMSALASALVLVWQQTGGLDQALVSRAEELALRAIDADRSVADAYHAIAVIRLLTGDFRAGLHALQQALARSPRHAGAHHMLGQLLASSGHPREGLARFDVALRLSPAMVVACFDRIHALALAEGRARAEEALARADAQIGPAATLFERTRLALWWQDRALAAQCVDMLRSSKTGAAWEQLLPLMEAVARGEPSVRDASEFDGLTSAPLGAWQKAMMHEIAAEHMVHSGLPEGALRHVVIAQVPTFIDVLWLDRCPSLDGLRDDPRFAEARALVAARAASIWD